MDEFSRQMRAVADDPPPTSIDLDRLIAGEYRRRRQVRAGVGAATVAVLAAVLLTVPNAFLGGSSTPPGEPADCPTVDSPGAPQSPAGPRPTEPCGAAIERLTTALYEAIEATAPGLIRADDITFRHSPKRLAYQTEVVFPARLGGGTVRVEIGLHGRPVHQLDSPTLEVSQASERELQAYAERLDGTYVRVLSTTLVLKVENLAAIGQAPSLTLFPRPAGDPVVAPSPPSTRQSPGPDNADSQRLTNQLRTALSLYLPDATLTGARGASPQWFVAAAPTTSDADAYAKIPHGYDAYLEATDGTGRGAIAVNYLLRRPACTTQPDCETDPECPWVGVGTRCTVEPDGTKVAETETNIDGAITYQVGIYRTDGTIVVLWSTNTTIDPAGPSGDPSSKPGVRGRPGAPPGHVVTRPVPTLNTGQLIAIGKGLHH